MWHPNIFIAPYYYIHAISAMFCYVCPPYFQKWNNPKIFRYGWWYVIILWYTHRNNNWWKLNHFIIESIMLEEEVDDDLESDDENDYSGNLRPASYYIYWHRLLWHPNVNKCVHDSTSRHTKYQMSVSTFAYLHSEFCTLLWTRKVTFVEEDIL